MTFEEQIQTMLDDIIIDYDLPEASIYQYSNLSNKGANKGKEISKSLCISEPDYPDVKVQKILQSKSYVIMNIRAHDSYELLIKNEQYNAIVLPSNAIIKEVNFDGLFKHIVFNEVSEGMLQYIEDNIKYCIDNYSSSSSFGCCSKYEQCSRVEKCLHINKLYSKGCGYRKNLEQGKIFY